MIYRAIKVFFLSTVFLYAGLFSFAHAATVNVNASGLVQHVEVSLSPRSGSYVEGSTFDVPILVNTKGVSINGIEVRVSFDKDRLSIVQPSGGTSIIGVWVQPPVYDNSKGTASYVGVIPGGITTGSGLIGTITFKAKALGTAAVSFDSTSKILLNDGLGTEAILDAGRANYTILAKAPEGPIVFSETHPFQANWYNNNNPVVSWQRDANVSGFSFSLDDKPFTIPDNDIDTNDTSKSFENLKDGLWYFHIKSFKNGVWGTTAHFLVRIDTAPPAEFKPVANYLVAAVVMVERTMVSFFTTDNLSGVDHYEVGVIDKNQPVTESPVFVEAESPFQVPLNKGSNLRVIVRAIDKAGNVRDESIDVRPPFVITKFIQDYLVYILIFIILLGLIILITHYLVGHHIIRYIKKIRQSIKKEELEDEAKEVEVEKKKMNFKNDTPEAPKITPEVQLKDVPNNGPSIPKTEPAKTSTELMEIKKD